MDYKYLLQLIIANLNQGLIVVDANLNVLFYYEPSSDIGGISPEAAVGKSIYEIFHELKPETSTFAHVIKHGKPLIEYVQCYCNYKGKSVCTVTSTVPLIEEGKVIGAFEIYRDFNQVMKLSKKVFSYDKDKNIVKDSNELDNGTQYTFDDIIGESEIMYELKEKAYKVANSDSPILIYGETGTGKELFVQAIHNASYTRKDKKFISQNCAALPSTLFESIFFGTKSGSFTGAKETPGLFELSNGGTLFLDEINSMDYANQGKLLRVLQDGIIRRVGGTKTMCVDSRIMASINEEPAELINKNVLRKDLYYRLNVIYLIVPPLRERKEDIPLLTNKFIEIYNERLGKRIIGVSSKVMDKLMNYNWPGNVRELKHTIESAMNFTDESVINCVSLSNEYSEFSKEINCGDYLYNKNEYRPLDESVAQFEKQLIKKVLCETNGNCSKAAKMLKIPRQTLFNKIKKYNLDCSKK